MHNVGPGQCSQFYERGRFRSRVGYMLDLPAGRQDCRLMRFYWAGERSRLRLCALGGLVKLCHACMPRLKWGLIACVPRALDTRAGQLQSQDCHSASDGCRGHTRGLGLLVPKAHLSLTCTACMCALLHGKAQQTHLGWRSASFRSIRPSQ